MDTIEKQIRDNHQAFEVDRHPEAGWEGVRRQLDRKQPPGMTYWRIAAAVLLLCTAGLGIQNIWLQGQVANMSMNSNIATDSMEEYYLKLISLKKEEYRHVSTKEQQIALFHDLAELDDAYQELKKSFHQLNGREELADAMLLNLQMRVMILNEQIQILSNRGTRATQVEI
jgi:hypothetical protein